jgi:hypothetical protein
MAYIKQMDVYDSMGYLGKSVGVALMLDEQEAEQMVEMIKGASLPLRRDFDEVKRVLEGMR